MELSDEQNARNLENIIQKTRVPVFHYFEAKKANLLF